MVHALKNLSLIGALFMIVGTAARPKPMSLLRRFEASFATA